VATMKSASLRCLKARLLDRICDGRIETQNARGGRGAGWVPCGRKMALRWGGDVLVFVSVSSSGGHLAFAARALKTVAVGNAEMRFVRVSRTTVWMYSRRKSPDLGIGSRSKDAGGARRGRWVQGW
jgi:hypothetical protein